MKKNFIKMLCEAEIQSTELALAVENISDQLQTMVEKITNLRTKDLSTLVKKIKYDNDIEKAQSFEESIGGKLDQLIQTITDIKGELDNDVVKLFNDENPDAMGDEESANELTDIDTDFGDEDMGEESSEDMDDDAGLDDFDDAGLDDLDDEDFDFDFDEIGREEK